MNRLSCVLLLSAFQASSLLAQRPLNPRYLAEFPTPERILLDIRANDPQETAARQMGALLQLYRIVGDLSDGRILRNQLTYDEQSLMSSYKLQQREIQETLADKTYRSLRGYERDAKFRDELLKRYLSPALQAQWAKITSDYNARIQGGGNVPITGVPPPPVAAAPPAPAPPRPAAKAAGPQDPAIAKARASNVDTKVFGFPLGEPLVLPKCHPLAAVFAGEPDPNCVMDVDPGGMVTALIGDIGIGSGDDGIQSVQLAPGNCPTWLEGCGFYATMHNGRFIAARLPTKGRDVETAVAKELRGKYGERASMQQRFITPDNGGKDFQVWDLDWQFPGLHVEYKVLDATIKQGVIYIESDAIYNQRKALDKEAAKPKL